MKIHRQGATGFVFFVLLSLTGCGGSGTSAPISDADNDMVTVNGQLSSVVLPAPRSAKQKTANKVNDWTGAKIEVLDLKGDVVSTGTASGDGSFSFSIPKGSARFIRATIGNLALTAFVPTSDQTQEVIVDPWSTAQVSAMSQLSGISNLGDIGADISAVFPDDNAIGLLVDDIQADFAVGTVARNMEIEIASSFDAGAAALSLGANGNALGGLAGFGTSLVNPFITYNITTSIPPEHVSDIFGPINGSISPVGLQKVFHNSLFSLEVTTDPCFTFSITGAGLGLFSDSKNGNVTTLVYGPIIRDHTLQARFTRLSLQAKVAQTSNGSISPSEDTTINCGISQTFTITPDNGFEIENVVVDGVSKGAVSRFTFTETAPIEFDKDEVSINAIFSPLVTGDRCSGDPEPILRVSVDVLGDPHPGSFPSINHCGDRIAFASSSASLVSGDGNVFSDVFVRDTISGTTTRVSTFDTITGDGNDHSGSVGAGRDLVISADGDSVAFASDASNFIATDTNAKTDVFFADPGVKRASLGDSGAEGDNFSHFPDISANGRYIAFRSLASNFISADPGLGIGAIFVRDTVAGTTTVASIGNQEDIDAFAIGDDPAPSSERPSISDDGRFVAFSSGNRTRLVVGDLNVSDDIFVRDLNTDSTFRVSLAEDGTEGNDDSTAPSISGNGVYIVFASISTNFDGIDTNGTQDIFVTHREGGLIKRVSIDSQGLLSNGFSGSPSISFDGSYIVFESVASNLVADDTNNRIDIFVHDIVTGDTRRVNVASDGTQADEDSRNAQISGDGRYIVFESSATTLLPGSVGGHVYRVPNPLLSVQ